MTKEENLYPSVTIDGKEFKRQDLLPSDIAHKIKGKTLEVYYFLVTNNGKFGVTEIQDALDYSTPSLVSYHLNRLLGYELIQKTEAGHYFIDGEPEKLGELQNHVRFASYHIPRIIVYGYHGLLSIISAILLLIFSIDIRIWGLYFIITNVIFLGIVLRDALSESSKLYQYKQENNSDKRKLNEKK